MCAYLCEARHEVLHLVLGVLLERRAPAGPAHVLASNVDRAARHHARQVVQHRHLLQHALGYVAAQLHDLLVGVRRLK